MFLELLNQTELVSITTDRVLAVIGKNCESGG